MISMREKIEGFASIFRFLTPILIAVLGYISIKYLSSIDDKFNNIDSKFSSFIISYHIMDKRIDRLEYKQFGSIQ